MITLVKQILYLLTVLTILSAFISGDKSANYSVNDSMTVITGTDTATVFQVLDTNGLPAFYFQDVHQLPCKLEKVCELMHLRVYWDAWGDFLQIEMLEGHELTKLNHKPFSQKDYDKLHAILNNPNSGLKEADYRHLTSAQTENQYHVDAVTSATNSSYTFDYIKGAVKTTYSLWHIVNSPVTDSIQAYTLRSLARNKETVCLQDQEGFGLDAEDGVFPFETLDEFSSFADRCSDICYFKALLLLAESDTNDSQCKAFLEGELTTANYARRTKAYNVLLNAGADKLLKKYPLRYDRFVGFDK